MKLEDSLLSPAGKASDVIALRVANFSSPPSDSSPLYIRPEKPLSPLSLLIRELRVLTSGKGAQFAEKWLFRVSEDMFH